MAVEKIIESIKTGKIRITDHADEEIHNDGLTFEEVFVSVLSGEVIEEYPKDSPYPSCLICGKNYKNEPIHSVWAYNKETMGAVLITAYRPDPKKWIEVKWRKK
ncbi:MAG: DUF4258 domain-containing protein [Deltaproteobacteria bacterium]|nr:DUF4258 domain-containing protein [Deltaproteobacteria bacterium]